MLVQPPGGDMPTSPNGLVETLKFLRPDGIPKQATANIGTVSNNVHVFDVVCVMAHARSRQLTNRSCTYGTRASSASRATRR
jgi:hypothetical protein